MEGGKRGVVERQAIRLHKMINRLDVDAVALVRRQQGALYARARSTCLLCQESAFCLRWLDRAEASDKPDFCPVLAILNDCKKVYPVGRSVA